MDPCAMGAVGRGGRRVSHRGVWLEAGLPVPGSQEGRRTPTTQAQCRMTLECPLNKGLGARESPASFIHHWP